MTFAVITDGKVNRQGTIDKFVKAIDNLIVNVEAEKVLVLDYINKLFDQHKGANIDQKAIIGTVVRNIREGHKDLDFIDMYQPLEKRVREVLKNEIALGHLATKKGSKNGGTYRVADKES
jgi:hypothetical protein